VNQSKYNSGTTKNKSHFKSSRFFYAVLRGPMTDPPQSTMAATEATDLSRANSQARTSTSDNTAPKATKNLVTRDFDLTIRAYFPPPTAGAKFNPIQAMTRLFRTMIKDEPSLVLRTPTNDKQLILASDSLPTGETEFKKYFKVATARSERARTSHVCIGCHVMSNRSLGNIKFRSNDKHLLTWLKHERVFIESDGLGTERPVTIGYFTKIAADLTHLANFRDHLTNQLMLIDIKANTVIDLAPHLKSAQLEAMSNGDEFVTILPEFEIYRTHLTHGRDSAQVKTDVLGVKCAPRDAKLLNEFFTRMASTNHDQRDGVFVPKGAVHLLGPSIYEQVLKDHNFFLTTVATIPINLEYRAWFAVIDPIATTETDPISLHEHLTRKSWFLRLEEVDRRKCLLITTRPNLPEARAWIDANLEPLIRKSIPDGIDPPASHLPRRLDKPVYSASSKSYAEALKQQFSLVSNATPDTVDNKRPPRKRQAAIIDYDSDTSVETPTTTTATPQPKSNQTTATSNANNTPPNTDTIGELAVIKQELAALRTMITTAVEQFKTALTTLATTKTTQTQLSSAMDTEADTSVHHHRQTQNNADLVDVIQDLKYELATIITETRAVFEQQLFRAATINHHPASVT